MLPSDIHRGLAAPCIRTYPSARFVISTSSLFSLDVWLSNAVSIQFEMVLELNVYSSIYCASSTSHKHGNGYRHFQDSTHAESLSLLWPTLPGLPAILISTADSAATQSHPYRIQTPINSAIKTLRSPLIGSQPSLDIMSGSPTCRSRLLRLPP
jgi:hypothetical protein